MSPLTLTAALVILCQLVVLALAIWCQLTPRMRTGSIATLALGALTVAALLGLARPHGTALALALWLLIALALLYVLLRAHAADSPGCFLPHRRSGHRERSHP